MTFLSTYDADRIQELIGELGARLRPEEWSLAHLQVIVADQEQRLTMDQHIIQKQQQMLTDYQHVIAQQTVIMDQQNQILNLTWALVQHLTQSPAAPCQELVQQIRDLLNQQESRSAC